MEAWGFWEWICYAPIFLAALVLAFEGAMGMAPSVEKTVPRLLRSNGWKLVPLSLLMVGLLAFGAKSLSGPSVAVNKQIMLDYGGNGPITFVIRKPETIPAGAGSHIVVDGSELMDYRNKKFKLVAVCYHTSANRDRYDETQLSKSAEFDIRNERIYLPIIWSENFRNDVARGMINTAYALLAVPPGVTTDMFETLRQAQGLGGVILEERGGPP